MSGLPSAQQIGSRVPNPYGPSRFNPRRFGVTAEEIRSFKGKDADEEDFRSFVIDEMYTDYEKTPRVNYYFQNTQDEYPDVLTLTLGKNTYPHRMDTAYFRFQFKYTFDIKALEGDGGGEEPENPDEPVDPNKPEPDEPVDPDKPSSPPDQPTPDPEGGSIPSIQRVDGEGEEPVPPYGVSDFRLTAYKFIKACNQIEISIGSNAESITVQSGCGKYQNRWMDLMMRPMSESNLKQEFAMMDMLPSFMLLDANRDDDDQIERDMEAYLFGLMNLNPTELVQKDVRYNKTFKVDFVVPLTLIHPMFNFNSILSPELDLSFTFRFNPASEIGRAWFFNFSESEALAKAIKIKARVVPKHSFLSIEQPHQISSILKSLKTKSYVYDILVPTYERIALSKPSSVESLRNIVLRNPKSTIPVKMDFMLIDKKDFDVWEYVLQDRCKDVLDRIEFIINLPFPYKRVIRFDQEAEVNEEGDKTLMWDYSVSKATYQSMDNFSWAQFGEEHIVRGAVPNILKFAPSTIAMQDQIWTDQEMFKLKERHYRTQARYWPNSIILLPSDQLNQNPFPDVRGSLSINLVFKPSMRDQDKNYLFFFNSHSWRRVHLENDKAIVLPLDDLNVKLDESK